MPFDFVSDPCGAGLDWSTFPVEGLRCYSPIDGLPRRGRNGKVSRYDGSCTLTLRQAGDAEDVYIPLPKDQPDTPKTPAIITTRTVSAKMSPMMMSPMKITIWDGKSRDISQTLITVFESEDYLDRIKNLRVLNIDPLSYINSLDKLQRPTPVFKVNGREEDLGNSAKTWLPELTRSSEDLLA
ncbi:hypothetical protein BDM02DRAFT_1706985 [Thelephora ganbajun]|uniref:Uncharacterized protein n=1 Tax=Thelephora ganbajun TaxID=370292 RepID=A0ACB6Z0H8_THEGA|nr:hypothetical protein BDM02DRAFT_1706985 [Thelephora ganbajun]